MDVPKVISELGVVVEDMLYTKTNPYGLHNFNSPSDSGGDAWEKMDVPIFQVSSTIIQEALFNAFTCLNSRPPTLVIAHQHFDNMIATVRAAMEFLRMFNNAQTFADRLQQPITRGMIPSDVMWRKGGHEMDGPVSEIERSTFVPGTNGLNPLSRDSLMHYVPQQQAVASPLDISITVTNPSPSKEVVEYYIAKIVSEIQYSQRAMVIITAGVKQFPPQYIPWTTAVEVLVGHAIHCLAPVNTHNPGESHNPIGRRFDRLEFQVAQHH